MKTIKTLAEALTGCTVEMGKTYYSKVPGGRNTRSMKIYDLPEGREEEVGVLLSALEAGGATVLEHCSVDNYLFIKIALPEGKTWEQYQSTVLEQGEFTEDVEAPKVESPEEKLAKLEIAADNFIATLDIKVDVPTVVPGYGIAVAFSEEDKAKLIAFIKKVVMFGIPEAIRLSNNPS